ncbi:ATG16-domain-containing protein [Crepidotus variabilis]|uniref:ATG16-domain-containing protein n=1 Tax=Crepidotus variabilis TaxID=179855 RepID=A0A9P6EVL2_9AGAR|nr:ATG16-domain-containing protein [Crepidotus variabilis]
MAEPSWQETLRLRLVERNNKESAFAPIIEQYRRLAVQTKLLKERNAHLLGAASSVRGATGISSGSGEDSNPVRAAYTASLETQISSLRDELANLYKTQGQNAQRLLSMNETLREKEELSRIDSENLRKSKDEIAILRRKVEQHSELMAEKDRTVQILHDEINTALLELGQVEERNQGLQKDNAKLLQRWLDAKQAEANRVNEANDFYETMRSRKDNVLSWREGSSQNGDPNALAEAVSTSMSGRPTSGSGKGMASLEAQAATMKNGPLSPASKRQDQTPNG